MRGKKEQTILKINEKRTKKEIAMNWGAKILFLNCKKSFDLKIIV